jgi:hypothetical protein
MFILLGGGCVCAYFAAVSCEFFHYESLQPDLLPEPFYNVTATSVGLLSFTDPATNGTCTNYNDLWIQAAQHGDFNPYFITAQFAALIGPCCGAVAWLINLLEWLFWSNQCTYVLAVAALMMAFSIQGLTFLIYGQRQFWYVRGCIVL